MALLVVMQVALLVPPRARSAGARDITDGWLLPVGELTRRLLVDPAAPAAVGAVAAREGRSGSWFTCGRMELYGLAELPATVLEAGLSAAGPQFRLAWQRMGSGLFVEDQYRLELGAGGVWQPSLTVGLDRQVLARVLHQRRISCRVALTVPSGSAVRVRLFLHLLPPPPWYGNYGLRRCLLVSGGDGRLAWAVACDRAASGRPHWQASVTTRASAALAVGLRAEPRTGSVGFTTAWRRRNLLLRSSHLMHPDLGITHRWSVTVGRLERVR